jgi:threonine dehydrogenase-like Zn-dependent dehydrogenase
MAAAPGIAALTVRPGVPDSVALTEIAAPMPGDGRLIAETLAIGVCGTDHEILEGRYGVAPPGRDRLVIGHESLARVIATPADSAVRVGELVVGIVRRPDPVPCPACALGEWDMCRNGRFSERGITARDGYGAVRVAIDPAYVVPVPAALGALGVLAEPASIVAKAWEQIERIGRRSGAWRPRRALVTGAGPIGLLAALMGVQRRLEVHVFDRVSDGPKPELVRDLGARYHAGSLAAIEGFEPDILIECTGASAVVLEAMHHTARDGIVCLTGVSSGSRELRIDVGALNRTMVLENDVVFGSVNANRRHYAAAIDALAAADPAWLARLVTRRVPLERWREAFERRPGDVKVVIDFRASA